MADAPQPLTPPAGIVTAQHCVIIGGGAAGYFAAIRLAELRPSWRITLVEATRRVLTKVHLSGGGRCNVTHHCFDPAKLVENYPRGGRELRGIFSRFQPRDTVAWFAARGVELKVEADGRMFPVTDQSATIAQCLEDSARRAGVVVELGTGVAAVTYSREPAAPSFTLTTKDGRTLAADQILLATGSAAAGWDLAQRLGHQVLPHVPSLFTFNCKDPRLADLAGVAVAEVGLELSVGGSKSTLARRGPLLVTHWGLSGPAVLKLSAFGAVVLHQQAYQAELRINWLPALSPAELATQLRRLKAEQPRKTIAAASPFPELPRRLWQSLAAAADIPTALTYADSSKVQLDQLAQELGQGRFQITGKGVFKDEFVSAGGVLLSEVDCRRLASRIVPGLYFAGEVLAIDGITGGFNFQAAWSTAVVAAAAMAAVGDGRTAATETC